MEYKLCERETIDIYLVLYDNFLLHLLCTEYFNSFVLIENRIQHGIKDNTE